VFSEKNDPAILQGLPLPTLNGIIPEHLNFPSGKQMEKSVWELVFLYRILLIVRGLAGYHQLWNHIILRLDCTTAV